MTPQERQLVDELFERLAKLESTSHDPDAERLITDETMRAPHVVYARYRQHWSRIRGTQARQCAD